MDDESCAKVEAFVVDSPDTDDDDGREGGERGKPIGGDPDGSRDCAEAAGGRAPSAGL